jgi:hypothetical protein
MMTKILTVLILSSAISSAQDHDHFEKMINKAEAVAAGDAKKILETGRVMTLDSALIIPGSCWDYANAVYERAGYSWNHRENVYKTVKAGPYADVSLIKGGDWLYYVNYSYGEIEHSAIFIDWIDYGEKIALMLSYGGERRREPARYMPYDLRSVYGITRARSQGETAREKTQVLTVEKKGGSKDSVKLAATQTISGVLSGGMKVDALRFGTNVQQMEIVGEASSFSRSTGRVYCWARVSGGQGRFVKIKWYYNGAEVGDTKLDIISNSMRTYSYRTVTGKPGQWSVEVVDPSGVILHASGFTVN